MLMLMNSCLEQRIKYNISVMLGIRISQMSLQFTPSKKQPFKQDIQRRGPRDEDGTIIFFCNNEHNTKTCRKPYIQTSSGMFANYQAILPNTKRTQQTYYFYRTPYKTCPSGWALLKWDNLWYSQRY